MSTHEHLDANVDYWMDSGYFVRVDVQMRRDSLYRSVDEQTPSDLVVGYVALSGADALAFADRLREQAMRVQHLSHPDA